MCTYRQHAPEISIICECVWVAHFELTAAAAASSSACDAPRLFSRIWIFLIYISTARCIAFFRDVCAYIALRIIRTTAARMGF